MIAVSLFDHSGIMLEPWRDAGYECWAVDIKNSDRNIEGINFVQADLSVKWDHPFELRDIDFVAAFPPCDHLAISGARWFKGKGLRRLGDSIHMFATAAEFCEDSGAPYCIENPISTIATYWRKPDYTFEPWHYTRHHGYDNYRKKTCLWVGNGFIMPDKAVNPVLGEPSRWLHQKGQGNNRATERAITPMGFAKAVFESNS